MQLLGTRIPDPNIQSIMTTADLSRELKHEVKTKKLADQLGMVAKAGKKAGKQSLRSLPNVELLPTRYKPSMAERALGRQKVIEQKLEEHGIEEPWKDMMERIEEHERNRRLKLGSALAERRLAHDRLTEGSTPDANIRKVRKGDYMTG